MSLVEEPVGTANRIVRKVMHRVTRNLKNHYQVEPHPLTDGWRDIQPFVRQHLKDVLKEEGVE